MKNSLPKIPYEIIEKAVNADDTALEYVLNTFKPYINRLAMKGYYDEFGRYYRKVNEDLAAYIQSRLVLEIIHNFKMLPGNEQSY